MYIGISVSEIIFLGILKIFLHWLLVFGAAIENYEAILSTKSE